MSLEDALIEELENILEIEKCDKCESKIFDIDFERIIDGNCEMEIEEGNHAIRFNKEDNEGDIIINIKEVRCKKCGKILFFRLSK